MTSVVGGRSATISAATGAVALALGPLNREHGLGYLVAAVILDGVFQVPLGALGGGEADAFRAAPSDGRLRQLAGRPDLHGSGP